MKETVFRFFVKQKLDLFFWPKTIPNVIRYSPIAPAVFGLLNDKQTDRHTDILIPTTLEHRLFID